MTCHVHLHTSSRLDYLSVFSLDTVDFSRHAAAIAHILRDTDRARVEMEQLDMWMREVPFFREMPWDMR